jgi:chromosome segregation ATPase
MYNDTQQRQHALSQYRTAMRPYLAAKSQHQAALSQWQDADTVLNDLFEHCNTTQAAVTQAETEYDKACSQLLKARANGQPYEQQQQAESEALTHLIQCRAEAKSASRKSREHNDIWLKAWHALQKAEKTAKSLLQNAKSHLPPPKPNALVLESALQHKASRDGLGWGFEHTALEQEKAYRKWLRAAAKRTPPSDNHKKSNNL